MAGNRYYRFDPNAGINTAFDDDIARNIFTGAPLADPGYPATVGIEQTGTMNINTAGVTVIRDHNIALGPTAAARYALTTNGAHLYFVNCNITITHNDSAIGGGGTQPFSFSTTEDGSTQFGTGAEFPAGRPMRVPNNESSSRTFNFFGCTFTLTSTSRVNMASCRMDNCVIIRHSGATLAFFYTQPPSVAFTPNTLGPGYYNNRLLNPNNLRASGLSAVAHYTVDSNATGVGGFTPPYIGNIQENYLIAPISGATVVFEGYEDAGGTAAYFIGNADGNPNGILSINPATRLTDATEVRFNTPNTGNYANSRIIESIRYLPTFTSTADNIRPDIIANLTHDWTFSDAGSQVGVSTAVAGTVSTQTYPTDSTTGRLGVTGTSFSPRFGNTADFDQNDGLVIPVRLVSSTNGASVNNFLRDYSSSVSLRSFNTLVDAVDGDLTYSFNMSTTVADGNDFTGTQNFPIDPRLRQEAIVATDTGAYITGLFDNTMSADLQDITELFKYSHYQRDPGLSFATWENGLLSTDATIEITSLGGITANTNLGTAFIPCNGTLTAGSLTNGLAITGDGSLTSSAGTTLTLTMMLASFAGAIGTTITSLVVGNALGNVLDLSGLTLVTGHPGLTIVGTPGAGGNLIAPPENPLITIDTPAPTFTVSPVIPAGVNGRWVVREGTTETAYDITNGVLAAGGERTIATDSTTAYIFYYKLDGVLAAGASIDYPLVIREITPSALTADVAIECPPYDPFFTAAAAPLPAGFTPTVTQETNALRIVWNRPSSTNTDLEQGSALPLSVVITAKNDDDWIDWHAAQGYTVEHSRTSGNDSVSWNNDVAGITGRTSTDGVQFYTSDGNELTIAQQTGFFSETATLTSGGTVNIVRSITIGDAPVAQSVSALQTVIDTSIAPQINSMANDDLIGIAPRTHTGATPTT